MTRLREAIAVGAGFGNYARARDCDVVDTARNIHRLSAYQLAVK